MSKRRHAKSEQPTSSAQSAHSKSSGEAGRRPGGESSPATGKRPKHPGRWVLLAVCLAATIAVLCVWPGEATQRVLPASVVDLVLVASLVLMATALGSAILGWLGMGHLPRPLALLVATALGVGVFSVAVLMAGLAGWIGPGPTAAPAQALESATAPDQIDQRMAGVGQLGGLAGRWFFFALPALAAAIGAFPLWRLMRRGHPVSSDERRVSSWKPETRHTALDTRHLTGGTASPAGTSWSLAAVVLVPVVIVLIAGANLPPGVLWGGNVPAPLKGHQSAADGEGHGYDVLEYHLQAPREYLDNGRISFLPHNVYASFPLNAEMWFMLLMGLLGRPQSAVYLVHWLNVLMMALAVGGVYLSARIGRDNNTAAVFAVIAVAATPMLAAVSVVAYVEPMMLMFLATALAMIRYYCVAAGAGSPSPCPLPERERDSTLGTIAIVIGLLLGFAAGAKYLAIPLFILPLAGGLLVTRGLTGLPIRRKLAHGLLVAAGATVALAPWLVRTAVQSGGNPFFPLLWDWFGGGNWTAADAARFHGGHLPNVGIGERLSRTWWRFLSHPSFLQLVEDRPEVASQASSLFGPWLYLLAWPIFVTGRRRGRRRRLEPLSPTLPPGGGRMPLTMPELHLLPTLPPEGGRIGPTRWDWMLLVTFAGQFGFWVLFTDQPGRFMLPAVIVLGLLVGRSMEAMPPTTGAIFTFFKDLAGETVARVLAFVSSWRSFAAVLMLILALVSGLQLLRRLEVDTGDFIPAEVREGQSPLWSAGQLFRYDFTTAEQTPEGLLNRWLADHDAPQDRAVLWLVGDATPFNILYPVHYNVVFSHDELADQLANRPPAEVANWLGAHGFRYVYVNWQEAARLRGTYGFPKSITRASIQGLGRVTILKELSPIPMALLPDAAVRSEDYEPPWIIDLGAASTTQPAGAR